MMGAMAIANGFQYEIKSKISGFTGDILMTSPGYQMMGEQHPIQGRPSYFETLAAAPGVAAVEPVAYLAGVVRNAGEVQGIVFKGVDSLYNFSFFERQLVEGRLPDYRTPKSSNEVLLSERIANQLGLQLGDGFTVYFVGDRIRVRKFHLVGTYSLGMNEFDELFALADLRQLQHLMGWSSDQVATLEIHCQPGKRAENLLPYLDELITQANNDDPVLIPQLVSKSYRHIYDWLAVLEMNVLIILVLMIIVSGFNMVSGLLILLFEKIKMIGLLKALGMRTAKICQVFVFRGMRIVLVGMGIGNLIAGLFCMTQARWKWFSLDESNYFVDHLPIHLPFSSWLFVNLSALLAIFLILWLPTLFISRVSPAKTLKAD